MRQPNPLNEIDYRHKLSNKEKEWLDSFEIGFKKRTGDVLTSGSQILYHDTEVTNQAPWDRLTTSSISPEQILLINELIDLGESLKSTPIRIWKKSLRRHHWVIKLENARGYCRLFSNAPVHHPLEIVYRGMKTACYCESSPKYQKVGKLGIRICGRWFYSFDAFVSDIGEKPEDGAKFCRIDKNKNYQPGNVKWVLPYAKSQKPKKDYKGLAEKLDSATKQKIKFLRDRGRAPSTIAKFLKISLKIIKEVA